MGVLSGIVPRGLEQALRDVVLFGAALLGFLANMAHVVGSLCNPILLLVSVCASKVRGP